MADTTSQNEPSTAKLIAYVIAYVLAFAAPTALLVYLFREHAVWIVAVAGFLMFGVAAFGAGWTWDDSPQVSVWRRLAACLLFVFAVPPAAALRAAQLYSDLRALEQLGLYIAYVVVATVLPIILGRWGRRWRS